MKGSVESFMHKEHFEALQPFVAHPICLSIRGEEEEEYSPEVEKTLVKLEACPDGTHLRLYFNQVQFLAIPFVSQITLGEDSYQAYDSVTKLYYHVKHNKNPMIWRDPHEYKKTAIAITNT
jgi:hypothetical protein